jgi:GNAT superfamily N-acetyltransferase
MATLETVLPAVELPQGPPSNTIPGVAEPNTTQPVIQTPLAPQDPEKTTPNESQLPATAAFSPPATKKPTTFMIRPAKRADYSACASILKAAFWQEAAMGEFTHPYRERFPEDVKHHWMRMLQAAHFSWSHIIYVADDGGVVKGVAVWKRRGPQMKGKGWRWTFKKPIQWATGVALKIDSKLKPNKAANPSKLDAWVRAEPIFEHFWSGEHENVWHLETLGVDPSGQGTGMGRALVSFGLAVARQQGRPASVVCSAGKEPFYEKCGYGETVGFVTHGEGNPLATIAGGAIKFMDVEKSENNEKSEVK